MRLFVAWYPGDPIYPLYDPDCSLLISPTSVAQRWRVRQLPKLPTRLMIDSGGYRYTITDSIPTQKRVFAQQLRLIDGLPGTMEITLCQLDYPLINIELDSNQRDRLIHQTIANAYELHQLAHKQRLSSNIRLMGIAQGYDAQSLAFSALELANIGYRHIGIGSLAHLYNNREMIARIQAVINVVGRDVHVFGVTGERIASQLHRLGVGSVDSSRPAKAAMYNVIFSSQPFQRHRLRPTRGNYQQSTYIETPFPCDCPICEGKPNPDLLKMGKREFVFQRTLHNYYHLKLALTPSQEAQQNYV